VCPPWARKSTSGVNEAEFIEFRFSAQRSRVGIFFDVRGLGFEGSKAALVVLTGVGKVSWSNDELRQYPWRARRGDWEPAISSWVKPQGGGTKGQTLRPKSRLALAPPGLTAVVENSK
jgi:hypothetical protein